MADTALMNQRHRDFKLNNLVKEIVVLTDNPVFWRQELKRRFPKNWRTKTKKKIYDFKNIEIGTEYDFECCKFIVLSIDKLVMRSFYEFQFANTFIKHISSSRQDFEEICNEINYMLEFCEPACVIDLIDKY